MSSTDGGPLPGAVVRAVKAAPEEAGEWTAEWNRAMRFAPPAARAVSDGSGRFRLSGLGGGRYNLIVRLSGYADGESTEPIEIRGQSVAGIDIVLAPGSSLRGAVTGLGSAELASVEVGAWQGARFRSASPDLEGSFELAALAPGTWQIAARSGARRSEEISVTLEPGTGGSSVELRFARGFLLSGQVLVAGQPPAGGFVSARSGQGRVTRARTDHEGRFEMEGLPAGIYELSVRHEGGFTAEHAVDLHGDQYGLPIHLLPAEEQ